MEYFDVYFIDNTVVAWLIESIKPDFYAVKCLTLYISTNAYYRFVVIIRLLYIYY